MVEPVSWISEKDHAATAERHWSSIVAIGKWIDRDVCIRRLPRSVFCGDRVRRRTKIAVLQLRSKVVHANVLRFFGMTYPNEQCQPLLVSELATKGRLTDVLDNEHYKLDDNFKFAMALDVATGMAFLHGLDLVHGSLRYTKRLGSSQPCGS